MEGTGQGPVSCGNVLQRRLQVACGTASAQVSGRSGGSLGARSFRRYLGDLPVGGIHAGVAVRNGMAADPLALRRYDEFGVTWPVPEETVWRVLVQQVT